jgi:hypothetical protein
MLESYKNQLRYRWYMWICVIEGSGLGWLSLPNFPFPPQLRNIHPYYDPYEIVS